jgi:hypothetical protein
MATPVYEPDIYELGIYDDEDEIVLPAFNPSVAQGLTLAGATNVLAIQTDRTRGEYGTDVILTFDNWDGQRIFTLYGLADDFTSEDIGRHTLLQQVDSLRLANAPLHGDLVASIGASEQPGLRVVLDNRNGLWTQIIGREVVLTMTATLYLGFAPGLVKAVFRGQVSHVLYQKSKVALTFSEP